MKRFLSFCTLILPLAALAQSPSANFNINGKVGSYNSPAKVYLRYSADGKQIIDSATLQDGIFKFSGKSPVTPTQGVLTLSRKGDGVRSSRDYTPVFLEPGTISVHSKNDSLTKVLALGTQTNQDYADYKKSEAGVEKIVALISSKEQSTPPEGRQTEQFKSEQRGLRAKAENMSNEVQKNFIMAHPKSYLSLMLVNNLMASLDYTELFPSFDHLIPSLKENAMGKRLTVQLGKMKNVTIGSIAPDFALPDTSGNMIKLASFRGKYVLVDLWASWCGPCRAENPNLVKAYAKYKSENFTILGVSLDRPGDKVAWMAAIKKDNLTWTHVSDLKFWNNEVAQNYGVLGIPQNFLLDPEGKIIGKNLRGDLLEQRLAEIFNHTDKKSE